VAISNGQPVDAETDNAGFMDKNADTFTTGVVSLQNTDSGSGPEVENTQKEINGQNSFTGREADSDFDATPVWENDDVGDPTDSLKDRSEALTAQFNTTNGHNHDGEDSPNIPYENIEGVQLVLSYSKIANQSAIGESIDISSVLSGQAVSSGSTSRGVIVTDPYNKAILSDEFGKIIQDESGNEVYGRVTNSGGIVGTWTLSFFSMVNGVQTAYSFEDSTTIKVIYPRLYSESDRPVYENVVSREMERGGGGSGSGSGGGTSLSWRNDGDATAEEETLFGLRAFYLTKGAGQKVTASFRVPSTYKAGKPISAMFGITGDTTTGDVALSSTTRCIRSGESVGDTTHENSSLVAATISNIGAFMPVVIALSDSSGAIGGRSVSPGDLLIAEITTDDANFTNSGRCAIIPDTTEVTTI
jgi:hypothetical protein